MIPERYLSAVKAVSYGARAPYTDYSRKFVENRLEIGQIASFNPNFENVLDDLSGMLSSRKCKISNLKKDLGITKADYLIYYMSFADWHNLNESDVFLPFAKGAIDTVKAIEDEVSRLNEPVGLTKQLELALNISDNDLTKATVFLALGTRAVSRGLDSRAIGDTYFEDDRTATWKTKVKAFGYGNKIEDSQGDTYHFWHAVVAGIGREEYIDSTLSRNLKKICCDLIYLNAAKVVGFLRNTMNLKLKSDTHESVDIIGYSVGRAFVSMFTEMEKMQ